MSRPPEAPVPAHVHWDEWIGTAPFRPWAEYKADIGTKRRVQAAYHSFAWRGWWDFGTGAIGDMACHTANLAFKGLNLTQPTTVTAEAGHVNPETCPSFAHVTMQFPARGEMPPVTLHWYEGAKDGKNVLPAAELVKGQKERGDKEYAVYFKDGKWNFASPGGGKGRVKVVNSGSFLVGEKATLFSPDDYGGEAYVVTPDKVEKLTGNPEKLPINGGGDPGQKKEWIEAIKAGKPELAQSNFDYAALLTSSFLLGNVAIRSGQTITWDAATLTASGGPTVAALIKPEYRKGWDLL